MTDAHLATAVERRTGFDVTRFQRRRLLSAVDAAMSAAGVGSYDDYLRLIASDARAFSDLAGRLTVGETYFFREPRHLDFLRQRVLPALAARDELQVRAWSAGCATGEEAYTVAILLREAGVAHAEVIGTDLSQPAIDTADAAIYRQWSLRALDEEQRSRYFERLGSRQYRLREHFRAGVRFLTRNLLDGPPLGRFDVVLCRNVLIYLTREAARGVGQILRDALVPGGWLVVGAADPLLDVEGLERVSEAGTIAYRATATEISTTSTALAPDAALGEAAAARPPKSVATSRAPGPPGDDEALPRDPIDGARRYVGAVLHLDAGRVEDAASEARAAVYLNPDLAVAHLLLGELEDLMGRQRAARRCFRNAAELLKLQAPDAPVPIADAPAGRLAAIAEARARGRVP